MSPKARGWEQLVARVLQSVLNSQSMAAKKTTNKQSQTKAAFVRAHANLSPKEIVEKAKGAGMKLDVSYVYNVRAHDKSHAKSKATKRSARAITRKAPAVARPISTTAKAEDLLRALGAELGLTRAISILEADREKVRKVLGA